MKYIIVKINYKLTKKNYTFDVNIKTFENIYGSLLKMVYAVVQ